MIKRLIRHPAFKTHLYQGISFAVSGLLGAGIELGSLALLVEVMHMMPPVAYIVAGLLSVTFVFSFNRTITFKGRGSHDLRQQTLRFMLVYSIAFASNYFLTLTLYWFGIQYLLAKVIAIGVIACINYVLSHGFIFRSPVKVEQTAV